MCDVRTYKIETNIDHNFRDDSIDKCVDISRASNGCNRDTLLSISNRNDFEQLRDSMYESGNESGRINALNIYRYKFTEKFTTELFKFSKIHQYDHRKDFKEAWLVWVDDNKDIVESEIHRLSSLSYTGNINDKMFKSARYYFRKKSTKKKAPIKRRNYVQVQKDLLDAIDEHIKNMIISKETKPSDGFDDFCKNNKDILSEEVKSLCQSGMRDSNEIKNKIKKTYKNRYFLIVSK